MDRLFSQTAITRLAALGLVVTILVGGCDRDLSLSPSKNKVLTDDERMEWWRDARFGLFVHWGLYAVPAGTYQGKRVDGTGEWIMNSAQIPVGEYEEFATRFNPIGYDADEWVRLAKNAGMKYIVITSKHHDGFCLWDSKMTDYDVMNATPFKRDILAELAKACKKHKIKLCFYHSIMDWHHPDAQAPFFPNYNDTSRSNPNFDRYVETYMKPQLAELLANYGPLGVLWFDGEWIKDWTEPKGKALYAWLRELQPDLIINNRVGKGRQGMEGLNKGDGEYAGDFGTPEQQVPATGLPGVDWETCMTMNDTWGFKSYDENWKSSAELIRTLVETTSKGGNFLLNVGPTPEGLIPQASVERLEAMGQWMAVNSESIYGTTASPIGKPEWGYCTAKGETLYLHVTEWPADGKLSVKLPNAGAAKAHLLADKKNKALPVTCTDNQVTVTLPGEAPDAVVSVVVLTVNAK
ncbi:MAG: alpha-L-fucosidase [Phycisphaerae bacterium]|nr:alpha-L-fucosidase [Phycisphaerae bacterium]